jgi:hypothetical protein
MKLATAWQASAYATKDNTLTLPMLKSIVEDQKEQLRKKDSWIKTQLKK